MARRNKKPLDSSTFSKFLPPGVPSEGLKWAEQRSSDVPSEVPPPAGALMTEAEARATIEKINNHAGQIRALLLALYEREGWKALGYSSWRQCITAEFKESESYLYRLLEAGKTEKNITQVVQNQQNVSPIGEKEPIKESVLRPLSKLKKPEQQREAWKEATRDNNTKPSAKQVETAVAKVSRTVTPEDPPQSSVEADETPTTEQVHQASAKSLFLIDAQEALQLLVRGSMKLAEAANHDRRRLPAIIQSSVETACIWLRRTLESNPKTVKVLIRDGGPAVVTKVNAIPRNAEIIKLPDGSWGAKPNDR
jgi:hypothetical protein